MSVTVQNEQIYRKLMESAKKIGQLAEKESKQADKNSTISQNVVDAIVDEGINKLILPKDYGWPQIDFTTFSDIVKTVGYHNLSAAWLTYFFALHNSWVAFLPKYRMDEIVNDGGLLADIFAPIGKVRRCDGGFLLSGKWNFVSGINYSEWVSLGGLYQEEGADQPERLGLCCRVSELTVKNDWDYLGLRGTGSNTVVAENVFIPEDMVFRYSTLMEKRRPNNLEVDEDYLYYDVPFFSAFFMGFPSMAIGAAERLLDEFKTRTQKRVRLNTNAREVESAKPQRVLAELMVKHKASLAFMKEYIQMLDTDNGQYHPSEYMSLRVKIIQNCVDIAIKVTSSLGATALINGSIIETMTRDLIAISTHLTSLYEDGIEVYGKYLFDIDSFVLG